MGRQGKMHSGPFHVESIRYMQAVEKEDESYRQSIILTKKCKFAGELFVCKRWNSGFKYCRPDRCKYMNCKDSQDRCTKCAYFYNGMCFHKSRSGGKKCSKTEAISCCYYLADDNQENFKKARKEIQNYIERCKLTMELTQNGYLKEYRRNKARINEIKKSLSKPETDAETWLQLQNELQECSMFLGELKNKNKPTVDRLNALGGEATKKMLREFDSLANK